MKNRKVHKKNPENSSKYFYLFLLHLSSTHFSYKMSTQHLPTNNPSFTVHLILPTQNSCQSQIKVLKCQILSMHQQWVSEQFSRPNGSALYNCMYSMEISSKGMPTSITTLDSTNPYVDSQQASPINSINSLSHLPAMVLSMVAGMQRPYWLDTWVLGSKLRSPRYTTNAVNHWAISPDCIYTLKSISNINAWVMLVTSWTIVLFFQLLYKWNWNV